MNITVMKPTDVQVKYLKVNFGGRVYAEDIYLGDNNEYDDLEDIFKVYPQFNDNGNFCITIDIDTGKVIDWPVNVFGGFTSVKVVDEGIYTLLDEDMNILHVYEGYVPKILEIEDEGWGDYFEFNVNADGYVENWHSTSDEIQEIFNNCEED